jgi:hypothetical protein
MSHKFCLSLSVRLAYFYNKQKMLNFTSASFNTKPHLEASLHSRPHPSTPPKGRGGKVGDYFAINILKKCKSRNIKLRLLELVKYEVEAGWLVLQKRIVVAICQFTYYD